MRQFALILMTMATPALAQDWQVLDGPAIAAALTDVKLTYEAGAWQEFYESGRTLYNAGEDSWGYWVVRDDQYCSQWPPQALWDCYDIAAKPGQIRFIGAYDNITDGVIAPK